LAGWLILLRVCCKGRDDLSKEERLEEVRFGVSQLPPAHFHTLKYLISHLHRCASQPSANNRRHKIATELQDTVNYFLNKDHTASDCAFSVVVSVLPVQAWKLYCFSVTSVPLLTMQNDSEAS